jgi:hypothetical protein
MLGEVGQAIGAGPAVDAGPAPLGVLNAARRMDRALNVIFAGVPGTGSLPELSGELRAALAELKSVAGEN